jgi:hypothetical protein
MKSNLPPEQCAGIINSTEAQSGLHTPTLSPVQAEPIHLFIVDLEDRSLVVYTSDMDVDVRLMAMRGIAPMDEETALRTHHWMLTHARYSKMLRFTLTDRKTRRFSLERWCFSGSIDNWIWIDGEPK